MSAKDDLRELENALDGALHGWFMPSSLFPSTKTGARCLEHLKLLRQRLYRSWGENLALRARLRQALRDVDGLRSANQLLTNELEALRGP